MYKTRKAVVCCVKLHGSSSLPFGSDATFFTANDLHLSSSSGHTTLLLFPPSSSSSRWLLRFFFNVMCDQQTRAAVTPQAAAQA